MGRSFGCPGSALRFPPPLTREVSVTKPLRLPTPTLIVIALSSTPVVSQVSQEWVARYDAGIEPTPIGTDDIANAIACDASGSFYVAGQSVSGNDPEDCVTIKYDPGGEIVWEARYEGAAASTDRPHAITVAASGCAYLCGDTSDGVSDNCLTVKYDADGEEAWSATYDRAGLDDVLYAIVVDAGGNAYVAGRSGDPAEGDDYVVIKYDSLGGEVWVARYAGPYGDDRAHAMAIDDSGNVCVTGSSQAASGSGMDFATVKYGPDGRERWVARHAGGLDWDGGGWGIAVDDSGNVFVGGRIQPAGRYDRDYAVIKYGPGGGERWVSTYDGGSGLDDALTGLGLDDSGGVYVTGRSVGPTGGDFATVKYDGAGAEVWVERYDGPAGLGDEAHSITVSAGRVWVAGPSAGSGTLDDYAVVQYDLEGNEIWSVRYDGPVSGTDEPRGIAHDGEGSVAVTGRSQGDGTAYDYATVKYDEGGAEAWVDRYKAAEFIPPLGPDLATDIDVDPDGCVYVTGKSYLPTTHYDCVTVKYDQWGNEEWVRRYNSSGHNDDGGQAIVVDREGGVNILGTAGNYMLVLKYERTGDFAWARQHTGEGIAMAVAGSGDVYVTGYEETGGAPFYTDFLAVRYGPDGTQMWSDLWDAPPGRSDGGRAIAVDDSGYVYVTGFSQNYGGVENTLTLRYDPGGEVMWFDRQAGPDGGYDIALDGLGHVCVAGRGIGGSGTEDFITIKYDVDGTVVWVREYDGPACAYDRASLIAIDGWGNVYVSGHSQSPTGGYDFATLKYLEDGTLDWEARYDGPGAYHDYPVALEVDALGNVYVTGTSPGDGTGDDYATVMYDPDGVEQWVARYDHPGGQTDQAFGMALDHESNVYVTGASYDAWFANDYATIKYSNESVTSVESPPFGGGDAVLSLHMPHPNPCRGRVDVTFDVPSGVVVARLAIYDVRGRLVRVLADEGISAGRYTATWDASDNRGRRVSAGVYFVRLQCDGDVRVRKVVVLR
jgi:uncharacterized delta-60 repeat protein